MFQRRLLDRVGWFDETAADETSGALSLEMMWLRMREVCRGHVLRDCLAHHPSKSIASETIDDLRPAIQTHDRWQQRIRVLSDRKFATDEGRNVPRAVGGNAKFVFVGAEDPGGQMAMWANAITRYTPHSARVLVHAGRFGFPSDLVLRRSGFESRANTSSRSSLTVIEEAEQVARDADLIVFAAGLAPGSRRSDVRLKDTDEQPFDTIQWPDVLKNKPRCALLFGTPSVRSNLFWYRDLFATKGWPVLTCEPDIHRWLTDSRFLPRLLSRRDNRCACGPKLAGAVAIVHPGRRSASEGATILQEAAAVVKKRFPRAAFGRYEDMSHDDVLAMKARAHIGLDRIAVGTGAYGLDSLENSSLGLVNVVHCDIYTCALLAETLGTDQLPWESAATRDELVNVLATFLSDPDRLRQTMRDTKEWFETYWNESRVVNQVADTLLGVLATRRGRWGGEHGATVQPAQDTRDTFAFNQETGRGPRGCRYYGSAQRPESSAVQTQGIQADYCPVHDRQE
jgi:hypothetical protein